MCPHVGHANVLHVDVGAADLVGQIAACVRHHMQFKDAPQMRKATLRRMLMRPTFPQELELHRLDCLGSHGRLDVYEFLVAQAVQLARQPAIRPPLLTGKELLAMGMKAGPAMGALLAQIREKQLQDELQTSAQARAWAKKQICKPKPSRSTISALTKAKSCTWPTKAPT